MPYYTYIATNSGKNVLYTGVTNDIVRRKFEHAFMQGSQFTTKYKVNRVVWYATFESILDATSAEKKIKGWTRAKKMALIKSMNPEFQDLLYFEEPEGPSEYLRMT